MRIRRAKIHRRRGGGGSTPPTEPVHAFGFEASFNARSLVYSDDGTIFFPLMDTSWLMVKRHPSQAALELYCETRAAQGFDAIALISLGFSIEPTTIGGHTPFTQTDWVGDVAGDYDEDYWELHDNCVEAINDNGMYAFIAPTWIEWMINQPWAWFYPDTNFVGQAGNIAGADSDEEKAIRRAYNLGKFLGQRYALRANKIVWLLGGDMSNNFDVADLAFEKLLWTAFHDGIIDGITAGGGVAADARFTFHPGFPDMDSWTSFLDQTYLTFHAVQSAHAHYDYQGVITDAEAGQAIGTQWMQIETRYLNHPVTFIPPGETPPGADGSFRAYDIRWMAYTSAFKQSCGIGFGAHACWQWNITGSGLPTYTTPESDWDVELVSEGSDHLKYLKHLIETAGLDTLNGVAFNGLITANRSDGQWHEKSVYASGTSNLTWAMAYFPASGDSNFVNAGELFATFDLTQFQPGDESPAFDVQLWWYNPRTGAATNGGILTRTSTVITKPGDHTRGDDWVAILHSVAEGFPNPSYPF